VDVVGERSLKEIAAITAAKNASMALETRLFSRFFSPPPSFFLPTPRKSARHV
jgi:hypothetical protein